MPRRRSDDDARRREINKAAWTEAELLARAHFERRRHELLEEAGLNAPHRRSARRRPDKLRDRVEQMFAAGGFADDPALLALARAFLHNPHGYARAALRQHFAVTPAPDDTEEC